MNKQRRRNRVQNRWPEKGRHRLWRRILRPVWNRRHQVFMYWSPSGLRARYMARRVVRLLPGPGGDQRDQDPQGQAGCDQV